MKRLLESYYPTTNWRLFLPEIFSYGVFLIFGGPYGIYWAFTNTHLLLGIALLSGWLFSFWVAIWELRKRSFGYYSKALMVVWFILAFVYFKFFK
jgi:hypothetical protein